MNLLQLRLLGFAHDSSALEMIVNGQVHAGGAAQWHDHERSCYDWSEPLSVVCRLSTVLAQWSTALRQCRCTIQYRGTAISKYNRAFMKNLIGCMIEPLVSQTGLGGQNEQRILRLWFNLALFAHSKILLRYT